MTYDAFKVVHIRGRVFLSNIIVTSVSRCSPIEPASRAPSLTRSAS